MVDARSPYSGVSTEDPRPLTSQSNTLPNDPGGNAGSRSSKRVEVALIVLLFGLLAGANGVRFSFNSAIPAVLLAATVLAYRVLSSRQATSMTWYGWTVSAVLTLWFLGAAASTVAHASNETILNFFAGYFVPLLIYACLVNRRLSEEHRVAILLATGIGALVPLTWGLIAYLHAFGLPSAADILWNRYDVSGMAPYYRVAFGNTSHMAHYLSVVTPVVLLMSASRGTPLIARYLFLLASAMALVNMLLIFSRATFLTCLLIFIFWIAAFRSLRLAGAIAVALAIALWNLPSFEDTAQIVSERTVGTLSGAEIADPSVDGRFNSMIVGWRIFAENPLLGVGPGMTYRFNDWSIAHQINVEEAAAIGAAGFISTALLAIIILGRSIAIAVVGRSMSATAMAVWSGVLGWILHAVIAGGLLHMGLLIAWGGLLYGFLALTITEPQRP